MLDESVSRPADPTTVKSIHIMFRKGKLTLREQSAINQNVTGSVAQTWGYFESEMLLGMLLDKGYKNLKTWAAEIEAAS